MEIQHIHYFDVKRQWAEIGAEALSTIDAVGQRGQWILSEKTLEFEQALASAWGFKRVVACGSGLDAIELALRAAGIKKGDKVLTTPLSAFATTLAITKSGGVPVFVDTDENGHIDLAAASQALSNNSHIRFFVPVHLYGCPLDVDRLMSIQRQFNVTIVEDCAQAWGATFNSKQVGRAGRAAAISFYPTKPLGALGDGGAVGTDDIDVAEKVSQMRNYGEDGKYHHVEYGVNSRLDEIQSALLSLFLNKYQSRWHGKRESIAKTYSEKISNTQLTRPAENKSGRSSWHIYPLLVKRNREGFLEHLKRSGVSAGVHYPHLIVDQPAMAHLGQFETIGSLDRAKSIAQQTVSLPIHPWLRDDEVQRIVDACNNWRG